jgi:hypothetical protein
MSIDTFTGTLLQKIAKNQKFWSGLNLPKIEWESFFESFSVLEAKNRKSFFVNCGFCRL